MAYRSQALELAETEAILWSRGPWSRGPLTALQP
jgi:hypothetical protein